MQLCVTDIKEVVQFKRKFHYIIPGREFFTTSNKKIDKIRTASKSLMLRNRKMALIQISSFSLTLFLFLATAWTNILF